MGCTLAELFPAIADYYGTAGVCWDGSAQAESKLVAEMNQAVPLLMKRMDAKGTLAYWKVPAEGGCFCLPSDCLEIRQIWFNGMALEQRDNFFEGRLGMWMPPEGACCCWPSEIHDVGDGYPLPIQWPSNHFDARLGVVADNDSDAGKSIRAIVIDRYGEERDQTIAFADAQQLSVFASDVRDVKFVRKDLTNGYVRVYVYYPQTNQRREIGTYKPRETTINYRKKKLPANVPQQGVITIQGKLRFTPFQSKNDVSPICDTQGLGFAFKALAAARAEQLEAYDGFLARAENELDKEMRDSNSQGLVTQAQFKTPFRRGAFTHCWS